MNKVRLQKSIYKVQSNTTNREVTFEIEGENVTLLNHNEDIDFGFTGNMSNRKMDKWLDVLSLLTTAVKHIKQYQVKKEVNQKPLLIIKNSKKK